MMKICHRWEGADPTCDSIDANWTTLCRNGNMNPILNIAAFFLAADLHLRYDRKSRRKECPKAQSLTAKAVLSRKNVPPGKFGAKSS